MPIRLYRVFEKCLLLILLKSRWTVFCAGLGASHYNRRVILIWTKNIFSLRKVILSFRNRISLSIREKELWILDTTTTIWTSYNLHTINRRSEKHIETNVCGSMLLQPLKKFSSYVLMQKKANVECPGKRDLVV